MAVTVSPQAVRAWRLAAGESQTEFGARIGRSRECVAAIEAGRNRPGAKTERRLREALAEIETELSGAGS